MFSFYKRHNNGLYNKLVELSRNIYFYKKIKLKDDFETRIFLIFMHFSIILLNYKKLKKDMFPQDIFDNIFLNIEYHVRELGYGDIAVNKKMKTLNKIFYNILLKLNAEHAKDFKVNKNILKEYFSSNNDINIEYMDKLAIYLESFNDFCFELDHNSMLKGQINFTY